MRVTRQSNISALSISPLRAFE